MNVRTALRGRWLAHQQTKDHDHQPTLNKSTDWLLKNDLKHTIHSSS